MLRGLENPEDGHTLQQKYCHNIEKYKKMNAEGSLYNKNDSVTEICTAYRKTMNKPLQTLINKNQPQQLG